MTPDPVTYRPGAEQVARSRMSELMRAVAAETGRPIPDYAALQRFALGEPAHFWSLLLGFSGLRHEGERTPALLGDSIELAAFFPGVSLNYAENLLAAGPGREDDRPALTACDEHGRVARLTRKELRERVVKVARALRRHGIESGDRVAAVVRNGVEAVIACLGAAAVGATW